MKPLDLSRYEKLQKPKKRPLEQQSFLKPDYKLFEEERCPKHFTKLKWNLKRTMAICKRKGFRSHAFTKGAVEGKNLIAWKEQDKLNRR